MLFTLLGGCAASPPPGAGFGPEGVVLSIPASNADGSSALLVGRVCLPMVRPAPVAVIAHGAPPLDQDRALMQPARCDSEVAQWFLLRGYMPVFALRRGFGGSGGDVAETSGSCNEPDYVRAGRESARDVDAVVRFAQQLPQARHDGTVVIGQSTGGWAVVAYDTLPHPGVAALISMAGGRGGQSLGEPDSNCRPDLLAAAAGTFGAAARSPMLWIYAQNDSFFPPPLAVALRDAYNAAGGHALLVQPPAFQDEGHRLFNGAGGSLVWGPLLDRYLAGRLGS